MADPIRIEVEDFSIQAGFNVETLTGIASDDEALMVSYRGQGGPSEGDPVTTSITYAGPSGTFDINLGTFDESDGDSRIVVTIGGVDVADFILDANPGSAAPDASTAVERSVATGLAVTTGDQIEITVYRDGGEYVRLDYLELTPAAPPTGSIRLEVEDFDNQPSGFSVESLAGIASGGEALMVDYRSQGGPSEGDPITASTTYTGPSGFFDLLLGTFDESDGDSRIVVKVGGLEVADFVLDENPGSSAPDASSAVERFLTTRLAVNTGDEIEITVYRDGGEYVRLDYVELIPTPPPPLPTTRLEVEDFDNQPASFSVESLAGIASGGEALKVDYVSQGGPAEGVPISTSTTYDGPDGTFDILLGTFDELGGDSRIVVRVDGIEVADFLLDENPGGGSPDATTAVERQVAAALELKTGDEIEITVFRDGGEYVRLDYLDLIPAGPPPSAFELAELDGTNGFRMEGIDGYDRAGRAVGAAGDFNGDGIDDLIVGAFTADPQINGEGESYVVFGRSDGFPSSLDLASLDGTDGFRLDGIDNNDYSGISVAAAGDFNGDGLGDLIIGAPRASTLGGEAYLVFGTSAGLDPTFDLSSLNGTNGFVLNGIDDFDDTGTTVSGAGDINGDGLADVIIGGPRANGQTGESYVVFGSSGGFAPSFDLSSLNGSNGFRLDGIDGADRAGYSVSGAGDFNGDGIDDLIIGAYFADPDGKSYAGESYVVFGSTAGFSASIELSALDGSNGFALFGIDEGDHSGREVRRAGDVNGDGIADVIIGAPGAADEAGESYVVFGSTGGFTAGLDLSVLDGSNGFRIDGIDPGDYSGITVSEAGDFNGDGLDDLLIGAERADDQAGEAYLVFGSTGGFAASFDLSSLDGTSGMRIDGIDPNDRTGREVRAAGDINGDGYSDLIIGAPYSDGLTGEAYVLFGGPAGPGSATAGYNRAPVVEETHLSVVEDAAAGALVGRVDAADPDLGDGLSFAITAGNDDGLFSIDGTGRIATTGPLDHESAAGHTLAVEVADEKGYVSRSVVTIAITDVADGLFASGGFDLDQVSGTDGFRVLAYDSGDDLGYAVAHAGDVNNDGLGDLIVGAFGADPGGQNLAGEAFVIFGRDIPGGDSFSAMVDTSTLDGNNGFRLEGLDAGDLLGISVDGAVDVNGDGIDDLIVGASGGDPSGEAYVIFGRDVPGGASFDPAIDLSALDGSNGFRIDGEATGDAAGRSVGNAGDVNGDGFGDLIIGARGADPDGIIGAGAAYVLFGKAGGFAASISLSGLDGSTGFRLDGIDADDDVSSAVSGIGDINGDGIDDLIVGAYFSKSGGAYANGRAYVVFGRDVPGGDGFAPSIDLSSLDGSTGFRIDGEDVFQRLGYSVSRAGDINGDGIADMAIGAFDGGGGFVIFGRDVPGGDSFDPLVDLNSLDGTNGFHFSGAGAGFTVGNAGDVNGDGIDDLITGARGEGDTGAAFVIFGRDVPGGDGFAAEVDVEALTPFQVFRLDGFNEYGYDGFKVSGAGDMNGDGIDDIVVGNEHTEEGSVVQAGEAYVFFGRANADKMVLGTADNDLLVGGLGDDTLTGMTGDDRFVVSVGDDTITDFTPGEDTVGLEGLFSGVAPGDIGAFVELTTAGPDALFSFDEDGLGDFTAGGREGTLTLDGVDLTGSTLSDLLDDGTLWLA